MYEIFEQLLKERGMSVAEFSRVTGISKSTLSDWKKGKFQLKDSKRRIIAEYFNVTLDYLDGRTDDRNGFNHTYEAFIDSEKYLKMHERYDVFIKLSEDADLYALVEKAEQSSDFRERLLGIVKLMENKDD